MQLMSTGAKMIPYSRIDSLNDLFLSPPPPLESFLQSENSISVLDTNTYTITVYKEDTQTNPLMVSTMHRIGVLVSLQNVRSLPMSDTATP